jgi:hypothetical protein
MLIGALDLLALDQSQRLSNHEVLIAATAMPTLTLERVPASDPPLKRSLIGCHAHNRCQHVVGAWYFGASDDDGNQPVRSAHKITLGKCVSTGCRLVERSGPTLGDWGEAARLGELFTGRLAPLG